MKYISIANHERSQVDNISFMIYILILEDHKCERGIYECELLYAELDATADNSRGCVLYQEDSAKEACSFFTRHKDKQTTAREITASRTNHREAQFVSWNH